MNRKDFQILSDMRLQEAGILLKAKLYERSYHASGLSVECALKACIAKQTRRFEFPDKARAMKSFDHNLAELVKVAGLQRALDVASADEAFAANWSTIRNWRVESRYTTAVKRIEADAMFMSVTHPSEGVMAWLHIHW